MSRNVASHQRRRAVTAVFVVVLLPVILGFAALTIDVGRLYGTRADLQNAADAAALAAAQDLGGIDPYDSILAAKATAKAILAKNPVLNGRPITSHEVVFGQSQLKVDGTGIDFTPDVVPANSVRVTVHYDLQYTFANIFGLTSSTVSARATAGIGARDFMIAIDASGSMTKQSVEADVCADLDALGIPYSSSGSSGSGGKTGKNSTKAKKNAKSKGGDGKKGDDDDGDDDDDDGEGGDDGGKGGKGGKGGSGKGTCIDTAKALTYDGSLGGPQFWNVFAAGDVFMPPSIRILPMKSAKDAAAFGVDVVQNAGYDDQIGTAAFGPGAPWAQELTTDYDLVRAKIRGLVKFAGSDIDAGILAARAELLSDRARTGADKVIVVFADGQSDNAAALAAAQVAADDGIVIHVVGLGSGVDQVLLDGIAAIGKGTATYVLNNTDESVYGPQLKLAFQSIASSAVSYALIE